MNNANVRKLILPKWLDDVPEYFPDKLINNARLVTLKRGEYLFHRGDSVDSVNYVLEGQLKAVRLQPDGVECVMIHASAGEFFAESSMAMDAYSCDGVAVCASRVLTMPVAAVSEALCSESRFSLGFAMALSRQARKQCSRYERLRIKRSRDRVMHFLTCEASPSGEIRLASPLVELAGELALEPETLYRTLSDLEAEGVITRSGRKLNIL